MMFHTLGTILALVAIHTGTGIVIYSVGTICTVFARIKVAVVDICTREINGEEFAICTRTLVYIYKIQASCTKRKELPTSF